MNEHIKEPISIKSESIIHWFVAILSIIYGCGFLIVFTFFKSYGIDSADFVEAKYIHVGFLFALACLAVIAPIYWIIWPSKKGLPDTFAAFIQRGFLEPTWKRRRQLLLWRPVWRWFHPYWSVHPIHGTHIGSAIRISIIFIIWSFIVVVLYAPLDFASHHPKLAVFNFLIPMIVLSLGLLGDFFKDGEFTQYQLEHLMKVRFTLRVWWVSVGAIYIAIYCMWPVWCGHKAVCECMAIFYFSVPLMIIRRCFWDLFYFPWRRCASLKMRDSRRTYVHKMNNHLLWKYRSQENTESRLAACQWLTYTVQWVFVIWQFWTFLWTIRPEVLKVSLYEILFGADYLSEMKKGFTSGDVLFPHRGIYFVFLVMLISFFVMRHLYRLKQIMRDDAYEDAGWAAHVSVSLIVVALFYISILAFAHTIYPYIPFEKGGGDYSRKPLAFLSFNTKAISEGRFHFNIPEDILRYNASNSLMVLEENDRFVFVAHVTSTNDMLMWRIGAHRPKVYELSREAIVSISEDFKEPSNRIARP